ncbi:HK97 family phage prohead protease [Granulicatella adiacens]|uniref:HK97 family phage prohead protease n=1 Tax=Granulicatella adiacens TaxID=46124 RepID=UPI003C747C32
MNKRESYLTTQFNARSEEDGRLILEGYFIKYGVETELWPGFFELIEKSAVDKALGNKPDVRALFNHDSNLCLGRTGNKTLQLKSDNIGLFGVIEINSSDPDAVGAHARVQRKDIDGCSFGFWETGYEIIERNDGTILKKVTEMELIEVSPCTFPAYPQTEIAARQKNYEEYKKEALNIRKNILKEKLKNEK